MASMTERRCKYCGKEFSARTADVKRGWARFCSKSCKATKQSIHAGRSSRLAEQTPEQLREEIHEEVLYECISGWDEDNYF